MQWLGAVVPHPHRDSLSIEVLPDVVGVNTLHVDTHESRSRLPDRRADEANAGDDADTGSQSLTQFSFVCLDALHPDRLKVADGFGKSHRLRDGLRSRLEALGRGKEG